MTTALHKATTDTTPVEHVVIYIPGLGDARVTGQRLLVAQWRLYGVEPRMFQMRWADGKPFGPKLEQLLETIETLHRQGKTVSLVAASAGASAALNAYAARPELVHGLACICGKIDNPGNIHPSTYSRNPAFAGSISQLAASLEALGAAERARILSLHPIADPVVPVADTKLPGAISGRMPVYGHSFGIAYGLLFGSRRIMRFLKKLPLKLPVAA